MLKLTNLFVLFAIVLLASCQNQDDQLEQKKQAARQKQRPPDTTKVVTQEPDTTKIVAQEPEVQEPIVIRDTVREPCPDPQVIEKVVQLPPKVVVVHVEDYTVQPKDTYYGIAKKRNLDVNKLVKLNKNAPLKPGMVIRLK